MKKKYIVYLGCRGFPYGFAEVQKIILISKSFVFSGNSVTVICKKGVHNKKDHPEFNKAGKFQDINYVYTSGDPFRQNNFLKRNFLKIKGFINEFLFIRKKSKNKKVDFAILSTHNFFEVVYYCFLSKLFGFKTSLNYVEYSSEVKKKFFEIGKKINDFLFDKYALKMPDSILPISEFLINQIQSVSPGKKYLKIPGLTDFERYNNISLLSNEKYFLFCGSIAYKDIILFIIDSFDRLINTDLINLYLVINGSESSKLEVRDYINKSSKKDHIKIFSNLPEKQLFTYYKSAMALLIPLRPTFQDIARFPHKTGEYLASGNPVISTNYGEVKYYFTDMVNMLLAENYDCNLFADKMQFVINNPSIAQTIGKAGQKVAMKLFDCRYKAKEIDNFFSSQLKGN